MGSIQEKWLNFKQTLLGGDWLMSLLIVGVAGSSFWLGQQSVMVQNGISQSIPMEPQIFEEYGTTSRLIGASVSAPGERGTNPSSADVTATSIATTPSPTSVPAMVPVGAYVASKNGTKYHLPWCAGAKAIKTENKIWFASKAEAEAAGYTAAANCKGI